MISPLQTNSTIDDRTLRTYLRNHSTWNLDESAPDQLSLSSSGNGDKFLNSSVHFPVEMRSANLNEMVSNIINENFEYNQNGFIPSNSMMLPAWSNAEQIGQRMQQMKFIQPRQSKYPCPPLSESGCPRNIPDNCPICPNPPRDIQVVMRKVDHNGINSLVTSVPLQKFRQMIGLQSSAGLSSINDKRPSDNRRSYASIHSNHSQSQQQQQQPSSSSSSSSPSSVVTSNLHLFNSLKQSNYSSFPTNDRQHSPMLSIPSHETLLMNYSGSNGTSTINDANLTSPIPACQEINYFRSNRRTGAANTLHIAIEKCYEQLNHIRDSYAETESKIGLQTLNKSSSNSLINDLTNSNFSTLSNNPSRVDRLITEYHYEYNRICRLYEKIRENLINQDIEATRQTLDEWINAITNVQDRRRQEIDNAAEKCRSGEPRLPDEKDVLQLAEALRILRITTRKIRTVLWYWIYWSTNSTINKVPLIARHQDEQINADDQLNQCDEQRKYLSKNSLLQNENNKENQL